MIEYRKLTHEDYNDILDISKDIWDGYDYLPLVFNKWVDDNGFFLGAVDVEKNKVVGVGKYTILYDGSGWLEGLRVHKGYRGLKIARGISEYLLNIAKDEMVLGNINKIGFGTHISNVESINLMSKMDFKLEKKYLIVDKGYEQIDPALKPRDFDVRSWNIGYDEFIKLPYFKKRDNLLPIAFMFQEPTIELFNEYKRNNNLITVNGFRGIVMLKSDIYFECVEDTFEGIDTFMNYLLVNLKDKVEGWPITSIPPEDHSLIEKLKENDYRAWSDWEPDYLYYVYK
ncbi:MAG: hypothetical protein K0R09_2933 [Clostridiales bacterium]|jgi:GNAT superfamily N-acetyltransferase|nr:hypothetical protein [Clostridiales bacterium]